MAARAHTIDRLKAHSMTTHAVRVVVMSMDAAPPGAECMAIDDVRLVGDAALVSGDDVGLVGDATLVVGDDAGSEDVVFLRGP